MSTIDDLAADIRAVDGDNDLGSGALAEALAELGWTKVAPVVEVPLKDYKEGEAVLVLREGNWIEGRIDSISEMGNNVHVQTERGPVTIATPKRVRRNS